MAKKIVSRVRRASIQEQINVQRGALFRAQAIIRVTRFAADSRLAGLDETDITFTLAVAEKIIDDAASELELVGGAS